MPFERPWLVRAVSPKRAIRIPLRLTRLGLFHNFRDLSDPSRPVQNYSQPTARNEDGYEFLRKEAGSWASADFCPRLLFLCLFLTLLFAQERFRPALRI